MATYLTGVAQKLQVISQLLELQLFTQLSLSNCNEYQNSSTVTATHFTAVAQKLQVISQLLELQLFSRLSLSNCNEYQNSTTETAIHLTHLKLHLLQ